MEHIIFLYVFFTGCVYTSWLWNATDCSVDKFITIIIRFILGWFVTLILIGRVIKRIMDE